MREARDTKIDSSCVTRHAAKLDSPIPTNLEQVVRNDVVQYLLSTLTSQPALPAYSNPEQHHDYQHPSSPERSLVTGINWNIQPDIPLEHSPHEHLVQTTAELGLGLVEERASQGE